MNTNTTPAGESVPYIPLSWLRKERKWAESAWKMNCVGSAYDTWRNAVDAEIARLTIAKLQAERDALAAELAAVRQRIESEDNEIEQILGAALRYPYYCDDPKNFPNATAADGVCVGEHTAWSLAQEAAQCIARLRAEPRYVPVEDGERIIIHPFTFDEVVWEIDEDHLITRNRTERIEGKLPDGVKVCRLVPGQDGQQGEGQEGVDALQAPER